MPGPPIAILIRRITEVIIRTTIANIITTIIRTGTGTGAATVIGITTMMIKPGSHYNHKLTRERREREKTETLMRFRTFAKRSTWKKARISRELGVSLSTVDRWLDGHDKIMLASMLEIRRFLEEREPIQR
jgi:hypothetical protein